jgi:hypothetical protein
MQENESIQIWDLLKNSYSEESEFLNTPYQMEAIVKHEELE